MPTELRTCPTCRAERLFEAPPCPDGHGPDCPELACTDCGSALLVGPPLAVRRSHPPALPTAGGAALSHAA